MQNNEDGGNLAKKGQEVIYLGTRYVVEDVVEGVKSGEFVAHLRNMSNPAKRTRAGAKCLTILK